MRLNLSNANCQCLNHENFSHEGINSDKTLITRQKFPVGLYQPEGSYRFGLDALLLGAFAAKFLRKPRDKACLKVAELGCGCGASLFSSMLLESHALCLGIDKEEELIKCAQKNALALGLERASFIKCDLRHISTDSAIQSWLRSCDCVLANPPWRSNSEIKRSRQKMRNNALWIEKDTWELFCRSAREFLRYRGIFCCILPPALIIKFCELAQNYQLGLKTILPVTNKRNENAIRVLLAFKKESKAFPEILPSMSLWAEACTGSKLVPSREALEFCPWLDHA